MKASDILLRVTNVLQDAGYDYWEKAELLRWLSDFRLDAYKIRPDLYEKSEKVVLVEGVTQTLPNDSSFLFSVSHNTSSPRKRVVTLASSSVLDRVRPHWRSMAPMPEIQHYLHDQREPKTFEVYPPARAGVEVQISYAKPPAAITGDNDELTEEGVYATAAVDYVLYRAFLKEADTVPAFHQRAMQHFAMAQAVLTGDIQTKIAAGPQNQG